MLLYPEIMFSRLQKKPKMGFVDVTMYLFSSLCRQNHLFFENRNVGEKKFGCISCNSITLKFIITSINQKCALGYESIDNPLICFS